MRHVARRHRRAALAALVALVGAAPAAQAFDPWPPPQPIDWSVKGPQIFDAVVLRPLGAGAAVAGFAAFVIAAPLAWYAEGVDTVWDTFVREPVDFTFVRPLGDF